MIEYFKIGKIIIITGLQGEVVLKHTLGKKTSLDGLKAIFTEEKQGFFPWFVQKARIKTEDQVLLLIEGIQTREQAKPLLQKEIWIPQADFLNLASKSAPISLLGYEIFTEKKLLGKIQEIIEQPHQLIAKIFIENKEVLIPLHQESMININHKNKRVTVQLPEGLLEIYLQ